MSAQPCSCSSRASLGGRRGLTFVQTGPARSKTTGLRGRGHPSEADAYPLPYGDSIGFWSDHTLVIHTSQVTAGIYHRNDPQYSEQLETVEVWRKTDPTTVQVDVWVYDPVMLEEPWFVQQTYKQVPNEDGALRIGYWYCGENPNNAVEKTDEGTSQFSDFTFTDKDNR